MPKERGSLKLIETQDHYIVLQVWKSWEGHYISEVKYTKDLMFKQVDGGCIIQTTPKDLDFLSKHFKGVLK